MANFTPHDFVPDTTQAFSPDDFIPDEVTPEFPGSIPIDKPTAIERLGTAPGAKTLLSDAIIPSFMESVSHPDPGRAPGAMGAVADVAKGIPEAIGGLATGLGGFMAGQAVSATQIPKDLMAGASTVEALAKGFDAAENIAAAGAYEPTTSTGRLLLKPIEIFFGTALGTIDKVVREFSDPSLSEEDVAKRSKAAQYLFNTALIGLPMLKSKLAEGKPLSVKDKVNFKKEVKKIEPEVTDDVTDGMLKGLREQSIELDKVKKEAAKAEVKVAGQAKFEGNQELVDLIQPEIDTRKGRQRGAYVRARKFVEDFPGDIRTADLDTLTKGKTTKTRQLIQKYIDEKNAKEKANADVPYFGGTVEKASPVVAEKVAPVEAVSPVEVPQVVPEVVPQVEPPVTPTPEVKPVAADAPIQEFDTTKLATGEGYKVEPRSFGKQETAQKIADKKGKEVIKVGEKYKVAEYVESKVPEFTSLDQIEGFKVMNEVDRKIAENDNAEYANDPEFKTVKVGDKYYRMERDVPIERSFSPVDFVPDEPIDPLDAEPSILDLQKEEGGIRDMIKQGEFEVDPVRKGEIRAEIMSGFKKYKERYVEKINKATKDTVKSIERPADLTPIDSKFAEFNSREDAQAFYDARGEEVNILGPDPETGKFYKEPNFENLDDYAWEDGLEDSYKSEARDSYSDDPYDLELTDTGTRNLWDIMNNHRGSIEFDSTPLKLHVEKIKEMMILADELGKNIPDLLEGLGLSPDVIKIYMLAVARLPEDIKKVKESDPIIERIINPDPSSIVYQGVTKTRKGMVKNVPLTRDIINTTFNARKLEWSRSKLQQFMANTETRLHGFERFGGKVKKEFWDAWTEKLTDSEREKKVSLEENKKLAKSFTDKEREEISIAAMADQKGGLKALAADGITEIPILNTRQLEAVKVMREKYDNLFDRLNYVRSHIGLAPIGKMDNYFPFIHKQNALRANGLMDNLAYTPLKKINGALRKFNGTFFPFAEARKVTNIPLELDVFKAYDTYLNSALKEIHVSPIAALAKEVATAIIRPEGKTKGRGIRLQDVNPGLVKFLLEWSDEVMGIDTVTAVQKAKHPFITDKFSELNKNVVAGMIFGNVGTVLKQPTALIGTYAMTSLPDVIHGISKTMYETSRFWNKDKASKLSNILEIRRAELILTEMADAIAMGKVQGAKKIASDIAAAPMNVVDALTAEASWNAAYRHAQKTMKLKGKEAIQYADDIVAKTQGVGIKGAVSPIQTTASLKWLTMLQTFAIADFNVLTKDILGIKNPDVKNTAQVKRVLRYVIGGILINEAFRAAGLDSPKPSPVRTFQDSKSEGDSDGIATAKALMEFLEAVPIVGGSMKYGSSLFGPLGELAKDLPDALKSMTDLIDWENTTKGEKIKIGMQVGEVLGLYYGVPMTRQIKKSVRTAMQGGNWYQIINGIYLEKKRGGLPGPPSPPSFPKLGGS